MRGVVYDIYSRRRTRAACLAQCFSARKVGPLISAVHYYVLFEIHCPLDAVERAVEEAAAIGELLSAECGKAREAVQRWRAAAASEAKLTKALREGAGTQQLSRAIKVSSTGLIRACCWVAAACMLGPVGNCTC